GAPPPAPPPASPPWALPRPARRAAGPPSRPGAAPRAGPLPLPLPARLAGAPPLRPLNRQVTPATAAIVARCLATDPAKRYPSARALLEDLECQLTHRPLRHTPEPSWRERLLKFFRRHPRLTSASTAAPVAAVAVLARGTGLLATHRRLVERQERDAAVEQWDRLNRDARWIQYHLQPHTEGPATLPAGLAAGREALERYGVLTDA